MANIVPGINRSPGDLKIRGVLHVYWSDKYQRWIARSWPKGNGGDTPKRRWSRQAFTYTTQIIKQASADDQAFAEEWAKASPYYKRDILMKLAMGTLYEVTTIDGKTHISARKANMEIQQGLDTISTTPGAMIVRTTDGWVALVPGDNNDVLTIDPATGLPEWAPAQGGGGGGGGLYFTPSHSSLSSFTRNAAAAGHLITPSLDMYFTLAFAVLTTVTGAAYRIGYAPFDAGKITAAPTYSDTFVETSGQANKTVLVSFGDEQHLAPNITYIIFLVRTDAGDAPSTTRNYIGAGTWGPGFYTPSGSATNFYLAKANPSITDSWSGETGLYICDPIWHL